MPKKPLKNSYLKYTGLAMQMGLVVTLCILGGRKLDEVWHLNTPWMTLAGSFIGVFGAIYLVIKELKQP